MGFAVKIVDKGLKDFMKKYRALASNMEVRVGVQGEEARSKIHGNISNVELFTVHEFGAPSVGIPQRSSLRATADEGEKKYRDMLTTELAKVVDKKRGGKSNVGKALLIVGETFRRDVLQKILSGIEPENKPATLARKKGETTPLISTGQMIGAITVVLSKRRIGGSDGGPKE